ncbi:MAG: 23S rRNA (guanosine(2251)-2'-O)-methyltransferase RlmB [Gammaproteobacteria bacterium TMED257]|nr:MAG: 23S rRNA (guanosine(2251)-2'-O)-methyltransferase RlmB [Gammaproteobacteria bacterium TMED257]
MTPKKNPIYIYGLHTCNAQLKLNPTNIKNIYIKKPPFNNQIKSIINEIKKNKLQISEVDKDFLTTLCLSAKHQGIIFELYENIISGFDIDLFLQTEPNPFIVILDSIQDPRNLGSCIRSANAAGVSLIVKKKSNSCEISPLVHKAASGGLQGLSLLEVNNLPNVIKKFKKNNITILGTSDNAPMSIYDLKPIDSGVAVIVGSEGEGVSHSLLQLCDDTCRIPIYGSVECLNVAVATGIILYQIQKNIKKIK